MFIGDATYEIKADLTDREVFLIACAMAIEVKKIAEREGQGHQVGSLCRMVVDMEKELLAMRGSQRMDRARKN